nr:TetR family transcriptional regulator [Actinokineospora bangkokensis]
MSASTAGDGGGRRRGRRPGGADTRAALLAAAREVFGESGYRDATVRAIAGRAGVDPAMVNHWFGGKEKLFAAAVLKLPFDLPEYVARMRAAPAEELGERIVRGFLGAWDAADGAHFSALIRSAASHEEAASSLRDFFLANLFRQLADRVADDRQELRAGLVASQMIGLGVVRYLVRFGPVADAGVDALVASVAPTVQRYLTGPLA